MHDVVVFSDSHVYVFTVSALMAMERYLTYGKRTFLMLAAVLTAFYHVTGLGYGQRFESGAGRSRVDSERAVGLH